MLLYLVYLVTGWLALSLRAAPRPPILRRPPVSRALRGQNAQYSIVYLAESGTAVSVETAEVDPWYKGSLVFFVSVLNRLCDVKHVKSTHKRFQTEWKNTSESGRLRQSRRRQQCRFRPNTRWILCVSTPIVGEWRRSGRCSVGDGGNRSPAYKKL